MTYDKILKSLSVLIAIIGLLFGLFEFIQVQKIEAAKPYLEKKLAWCQSAVETASSIANSKIKSDEKIQKFWELYWGVMGMIEKKEIENAMKIYGDSLKAEDMGSLKRKSLLIAHACRTELAKDWSSYWER